MKLKNLIFAWVLLSAGLLTGREMSLEWYREKDQSWAQTRAEFPQSAVAGAFKSRMLEIDEWAKANNPNLHQDPNKPYLMAQMVQREFDGKKASLQTDEERQFDERFDRSIAQATAAYPSFAKPESPLYKRVAEMDMALKLAGDPLFDSPEKSLILAERAAKELVFATKTGASRNSPAVYPPEKRRSDPSGLEGIVQAQSPSKDHRGIRLGAILIVALSSAVAYFFFWVVSPKPGIKTPLSLARKWAAWGGVLATVSVLPEFFRQFNANSLAIWILAIVFFTPVAFVIGWICGLVKYRQPEVDVNGNIMTAKLQHFAEMGNIDMARCVEIVHAANDALTDQHTGANRQQVGVAMFRCCGVDEDEAAYFRCAVDSLLQEKWRATQSESGVFTTTMNTTYQEILNSLSTSQNENDVVVFSKEVSGEAER